MQVALKTAALLFRLLIYILCIINSLGLCIIPSTVIINCLDIGWQGQPIIYQNSGLYKFFEDLS